MGVVGGLLSAIGDALLNPSSAGGSLSDEEIRLGFIHTQEAFTELAQFLNAVLGDERQAWEYADPQIQAGALGLGQLAYNELQAWTRLLNQILPSSLAWLDGKIHVWVHDYFDPFKHEMLHRWTQQYDWNTAQIHWEQTYVTPNIEEWRRWHKWFDGWPATILTVLHDWVQHPSHFAAFAVPPIAKPILDFWTRHDTRNLRDQLTALVLDTTPDETSHAISALFVILAQEY